MTKSNVFIGYWKLFYRASGENRSKNHTNEILKASFSCGTGTTHIQSDSRKIAIGKILRVQAVAQYKNSLTYVRSGSVLLRCTIFRSLEITSLAMNMNIRTIPNINSCSN